MRLRRFARAAGVVMLAWAAAACGGGGGAAGASPTQALTAPPSQASQAPGGAGGVCPWLMPGDFASVGVDGAGNPTDNADGTGSHYCVYAGASGATGGIELDVFLSGDEAEADATYATATSEGPVGEAVDGAGFDESSFAVDGDVAYLTARRASVVIALSVPNEVNTRTGLVELAKLAFGRAGG